MSRFATGCYVAGPTTSLRIERLGQDANGHCLYSVDGGEPEHIAPASDLRKGDTSQLTCPLREVAE